VRDKKFPKRKKYNQASFSSKTAEGYPQSAKQEHEELNSNVTLGSIDTPAPRPCRRPHPRHWQAVSGAIATQ
jgi:hypothetical protein